MTAPDQPADVPASRKVTVRVKRSMTATTVELRAREGLRLGIRLVARSLIALIRGRRVRLVLRRPGAGGEAVALATEIAAQTASGTARDDGGDERIRTAE